MMKNILIVVFLTICVCSTVWAENEVEKVSYKKMLNLNAQNIRQIKEGMTIPEVVTIMMDLQAKVRSGPLNNPWRIEYKGDTEIYHYLTRGHPPFLPILENQAIPVIFVDGKVTAVGRQFLKEARSKASLDEPLNEAPEGTLEERLAKLKDLREKGLIDQQEYDSQKKRILDSI